MTGIAASPETVVPGFEPTVTGMENAWAVEAKPRRSWRQRILEGLPGFLMGGATVAAAKCTTAALCTGASMYALLPAVAVAGGWAAETVTYTRKRWQEAKEQDDTLSFKSLLFKKLTFADVGQELSAYGKAASTKSFWGSALKKGTLSTLFGAAAGYAVLEAFDWVKDTFFDAQPAASQSFSGQVTQAPAEEIVEAPQEAAAAPVPATPLDQARALMDAKGLNEGIARDILAKAEAGNVQAQKDLGFGFLHGKFGLEVNKDLAMAFYEKAAEGGNAQAIRDLAILSGKAVPVTAAPVAAFAEAAVTAAPAAAEIASPLPDVTGHVIDADMVFPPQAGEAVTAAAAPQPTAPAPQVSPETLELARTAQMPTQTGNEAGRCIGTLIREEARNVFNNVCSIFKTSMVKDDVFVFENHDGSIKEGIAYEGDEPIATEKFRSGAQLDFLARRLIPGLN